MIITCHTVKDVKINPIKPWLISITESFITFYVKFLSILHQIVQI